MKRIDIIIPAVMMLFFLAVVYIVAHQGPEHRAPEPHVCTICGKPH